MRTPRVCFLAVLTMILTASASAGQVSWIPGGEGPVLVLSLGDGLVKQTYTLPSGTDFLTLTLRKFLLEDDRIQITWKNDGVWWMRQNKKIPGDETTDRVALPPGRRITIEIATPDGTSMAAITLRRN